MRTLLTVAPLLVLLASGRPLAQAPAPARDLVVDAAMRNEVIDGALRHLNDGYVFPEMAGAMSAAIRARQQRHEYDGVTSGRRLAELLTEHLREVSKDKHLNVFFNADPVPPPPPPPPGGGGRERMRAFFALRNFDFFKLERLAGNIGYLDLRGFMPPDLSGETATAAMTFLADMEAVIVDLRQNGGGAPQMVAFMTSYFVGPEPVHLNDFYDRTSGRTMSSWTLATVPGKRLLNKDLYILTGPRTFSGAEEFTYNLKALKRATIVGENTGGGAHLVRGVEINAHFGIGVPSGRPINAITKGNWEGTGVEPDVKIPADLALAKAHLMAIEKLRSDIGDSRFKEEVKNATERLRKELAR
jgi:hypothetical protein